jgi:hypothetical protein
MNRQQSISSSQFHSLSVTHLAQMYLSDDALGDEFDWDESVSQYDGDSMASDILGRMHDFGAE